MLLIINFWAVHLVSAHTCKRDVIGSELILRACCGSMRTKWPSPAWASVGPAEPISL